MEPSHVTYSSVSAWSAPSAFAFQTTSFSRIGRTSSNRPAPVRLSLFLSSSITSSGVPGTGTLRHSVSTQSGNTGAAPPAALAEGACAAAPTEGACAAALAEGACAAAPPASPSTRPASAAPKIKAREITPPCYIGEPGAVVGSPRVRPS